MVINGLLGHLSNVAHTFLEAYNVGGFDLLNKGRLIIVANSNTLLEISRLVVMVMTLSKLANNRWCALFAESRTLDI